MQGDGEVANEPLRELQVALVQGDGEVGKQLVRHPSVSLVALTGSAATGSAIMKEAAASLKRVSCQEVRL